MNADASAAPTATVRVILVADPDLPTEIAEEIARGLPERLREQGPPGTDWLVGTVTAPLVGDEQVDVAGMVEIVRPHLTGRDWDIGVFLTDLPRRAEVSPVIAEVSPTDHVALVSLPALGSLRLTRRAARAVAGVIGLLTASDDGPGGALPAVIGHRLTGPAAGDGPPGRPAPDRYVLSGPLGRLRLVAGMVRANRPWRLFTTLSRALAGVFATAAYGLINNTSWDVAAALGIWRQVLIAVLSVAALTAWIIIDHELWERPKGDLPRARARLYNLVTVLTIAAGVLFLYVMIFVTVFGVSALLVAPSVLADTVQRPADVTEYLSLTWFVSSIAMIGGAFGSGLEDDGTVRMAAYGQRHRERREVRRTRPPSTKRDRRPEP
jgi:hypothetical protein